MNDEQMNAPASKGQVLVSIDKWGTDYWANLSGGEVSGDSKPVWSGGADRPDLLAARASTSNLVLTKPYKPGRDKERIEAFARQVSSLRATITVQDTDEDFNGGAYGKPRVYPNCRLVRVKLPELEAGSGDENVIETEWATSGLA